MNECSHEFENNICQNCGLEIDVLNFIGDFKDSERTCRIRCFYIRKKYFKLLINSAEGFISEIRKKQIDTYLEKIRKRIVRPITKIRIRIILKILKLEKFYLNITYIYNRLMNLNSILFKDEDEILREMLDFERRYFLVYKKKTMLSALYILFRFLKKHNEKNIDYLISYRNRKTILKYEKIFNNLY
jgi:hypothetical protein